MLCLLIRSLEKELMATKLKYLQKVEITSVLKRITSPCHTSKKVWEKTNKWERWGTFLGYRTLSNGNVWISSDEPAEYTPTEYFKAALVSLSERENPVYVSLDAIKPA